MFHTTKLRDIVMFFYSIKILWSYIDQGSISNMSYNVVFVTCLIRTRTKLQDFKPVNTCSCREYWEERRKTERAEKLQQAKEY